MQREFHATRSSGGRDETVRQQIKEVNDRLAGIDNQLATDFPNYQALASPKPVSAAR